MSEIETAIAGIEQAVSDYAEGTREEVAESEIEDRLSEIRRLGPKTPQVGALLSQIRHIAPVVLRLRAEKRYGEIEKGKRLILDECARLREVLL
jgi:hypothetical protein